MAVDVDKKAILADFSQSVKGLASAEKLGKSLGTDIDMIYLVGCGAPNRIMLGLEYWVQHYSPSIEVRRYFPAEFMAQDPAKFNERTLVLLGSKSGTTPETVAAAEFVKNRKCVSVGVTQTKDLPLAKSVHHKLLMGETGQAHTCMFLLMQAFVGAIMEAKDEWSLQKKLMSSLKAMPEVIADTQIANDTRSIDDARLLKDDRNLYHVASGPTFGTAYVFGVCILMEMQWMHSVPLEAAEFFHGPFEIVDENTPLILMLGEDPSRPLMDRVVRFCKKYTERLFIYDSKDFEMKGVDPEIRAIVAPYVIEAALYRVAARLAVWHNHPLSTRRYMWKTEY